MCFDRQRIPKHLLLQPTFPAHQMPRRRLRWILPRALAMLVGIAAIYFYANAQAYPGDAPRPANECQHTQR